MVQITATALSVAALASVAVQVSALPVKYVADYHMVRALSI